MKQVVFLVAWLLAWSHIPAKAQPIGNEALIDSLLFKALDSLTVSRYFDSSGVQVIVRSLSPEKRAYCRTMLIRYFNRKGIPVFQEKRKSELALTVFEPKIEYEEPPGELLGLSGTIKRKVRLRLEGWLVAHKADRSAKALQVQLTYSDRIKRKHIAALEASPFLFVKGKWVSYSRWTRFLQPAVVLGSVSVLIYLFFRLRS